MLEETADRAREREPRPVERVHETWLLPLCRPVPDVRTPGLKVEEVAARRHLEPSADARGPGLEIVGLGAREAGVTGGEQLDAIRESELAERALSVPGEDLELVDRLLGRRVPDQLHLVELVHAKDAARVLAGRSGLAAEARRVRDEAFRQRRSVEDLVAVEVRDRHLGGRYEKEFPVADAVQVVLELRQVARADHRLAIDEHGGPDLLVPVLPTVQVDEEVHQRADEARSVAAKHGEARATDLRGAREVDEPALGGNLPMRSNAVASARRAPLADDHAVLFPTLGNFREREVRQPQHDLLERALGLGELALETGDLLAERAAAGNEIVGRLPRPSEPGDFLRGGVTRRLALLDSLDRGTAVALERGRSLEEWRVLLQRAAPAHRLAQRIDLLAKDADVVHGYSVGTPGTTSDLKPQFGSAVTRRNTRRSAVRTLSTTSFA